MSRGVQDGVQDGNREGVSYEPKVAQGGPGGADGAGHGPRWQRERHAGAEATGRGLRASAVCRPGKSTAVLKRGFLQS